ncbi:putative acetyltransferase [Actinacidiphila reveromycinica]|uniref:Putative acetyltransferase n=1 Tax=Actinacidiphila reveromycinica TaxID=659352 RepID=A0A7U3VQN7_9ACTN|nr:GNAT family N-acetyltransferase [Streptomyces sp. SN-593]BBA99883.1 putative acetyltransferase [Streptomyces sp. SN-593]
MPGDFSSGVRLEIRITPADVGKRVSVRQVIQVTDGHPTFTDTVGVLASWDTGVVCVTRRTGETVRIGEETLVAGKVVPPAPERRGAGGRGAGAAVAPGVSEGAYGTGRAGDAGGSGVPVVTAEEIEAVASRAWPAVESAPLGGWTLRAAGGFTRRANSVLVTGDPGVPLPRALAAVTRWYRERGLAPLLQVPDSSPYADEVARAGWTHEADTLVRTAPLGPLTDLPEPPGAGVELSRAPDAAWLAAYHRTGELADAALRVVSGGPSVWFAGAPGAIGRAVVEGPWVLFGAVEVAPGQRRRGLATAVMGALARRAYDEGARAAYLQVEADNAAARALYDGLGFTDHHRYHYRRSPA